MHSSSAGSNWSGFLARYGKDSLDAGQHDTQTTDSTDPLHGARLLFGDGAASATPRQLDGWLVELEATLGVEMGMQVLEDSLCNWQKNPARFVPFRG